MIVTHTVSKQFQTLLRNADNCIERNETNKDLVSEMMAFKQEREEALKNIREHFPSGHVNDALEKIIKTIDDKIKELEAIYEDK